MVELQSDLLSTLTLNQLWNLPTLVELSLTDYWLQYLYVITIYRTSYY